MSGLTEELERSFVALIASVGHTSPWWWICSARGRPSKPKRSSGAALVTASR
jgi:hypothetical protein